MYKSLELLEMSSLKTESLIFQILLVNGILSKSAFTLTEKKYNLMEFEILIGPSIQSCCFEVSNDVVDQFDRRFITPKSDEKFQVDLQQNH